MTDEEFESFLSEIRSSVENYMKDGSTAHLVRTRNAWLQLESGGRRLEADAILQAESKREMAACISKLEGAKDV